MYKETSISSFRNLRSILKQSLKDSLCESCAGWVGQKMPHRSRVFKTWVLKSKTESLRLDFGTSTTIELKKEPTIWRRRTDLKKNQWFDDEEPMIWRRRKERFDDEELRNDLTTKNRSEWAIGRFGSDLHEELRRSWGWWSETRVRLPMRGDGSFLPSMRCACLCRWVCRWVFWCLHLSLPMGLYVWVWECSKVSADGLANGDVCACLRLGFVCLGARVFWFGRRSGEILSQIEF